MKKSKIFFVSTEIYPFIKSGRAGEFAGSLPTYLQMAGHEVRVMMPKYSLINERKHIIRDIIRLKDIPVILPFDEGKVSVKSGFLPESKTQIYFADYEKYFKKSDVFRDKRTGQFFKDNDERFIFFARAAIETLKTLGWQPDVIHCCDWATGVLPAMIRQEQKQNSFFRKSIIVYSINDLEETGNFDKSVFAKTGLDKSIIDLEKCLSKSKFSFLKTGLAFSDAVTIPTTHKHLRSIEKPRTEFETILAHARNVSDLPHGGDHNLWNPANNSSLHKPYSADKYDRRKTNKEKFLESKRTGFSAESFILGIVSEDFESQKKSIAGFLRTIRDQELQIFLIADTNPLADGAIKTLVTKNVRHKVFAAADPDDQLRHNFFAVSDLFWVPPTDTYSEITYLNGIHYGALPIIHKETSVAGLFEPVKDKSYSGNAFIYADDKDLVAKMQMAGMVFKDDQARWDQLARNAMKTDLTWSSHLHLVTKIYERAFAKLK